MRLTRTAFLEATTLWFTMRRSTAEGRVCREYAVANDAGAQLLTARAYNWRPAIVAADADGTPLLVIRRSRLFVLNGRAAVRELPSQRHIGDVSRSGWYRDAAGQMRGRIRDARTAGERARESLFQAAADALLNADGSSVASGPDSFVVSIGDRVAATLSYAALPFADAVPSMATSWSRFADRFLPARAREAIRARTAPRGWRFQRRAELPGDPQLHIAAALFAIELSRW